MKSDAGYCRAKGDMEHLRIMYSESQNADYHTLASWFGFGVLDHAQFAQGRMPHPHIPST